MGILLLPKRYHPDFINPKIFPKGPVEIDRDNYLTYGLIFATYLEGSKTHAILGGANNASVDDGGASFDGWNQTIGPTTSILQYSRPPKLDYSLGSIATAFECIEAPANNAKIFITTDDEFQIFRTGGDNSVRFEISGFGAADLFTFTDDVFSIGNETILSAIWDDTANIRSITSNGEKLTAATAFTGGTESFATYNLLNRSDGIRQSGCKMRYHFIWDRVLSDQDLARVHENPYQLLKPATSSLYLVPSAAPPAGRIMGSLAGKGGLAGMGGIAGPGGGLAG